MDRMDRIDRKAEMNTRTRGMPASTRMLGAVEMDGKVGIGGASSDVKEGEDNGKSTDCMPDSTRPSA